MRRINNHKIAKESFEDMCKAKRLNPSLEITFKDKAGTHTHKIGAGYHDDIHVYRDKQKIYILTTNSHLGYVGLEVFNGDDKTGDLFLEHHQAIEVLGRCDLAPFNIIRRLMEYVNP